MMNNLLSKLSSFWGGVCVCPVGVSSVCGCVCGCVCTCMHVNGLFT